MTTKFRQDRPGTGAGFTLVEVVLSLGIIATALLGVMGLLTLAAGGASEAANDTLASQISTRIIGELQMADWDQLQALSSARPLQYWNEFGQELEDANAQGLSIYTSQVILVNSTQPSLGTVNVGPSGSNDHLFQIRCLVSCLPGPSGEVALNEVLAGEQHPKVRVFSSVISHMEKLPTPAP